MERIKRHLRSAAGYLAVCAKWLVLAALVGCVVGPLGGAFGLALNWANATRGAHPWLLYLLPVAGLVIVFLYHRFDPDGGGSWRGDPPERCLSRKAGLCGVALGMFFGFLCQKALPRFIFLLSFPHKKAIIISNFA